MVERDWRVSHDDGCAALEILAGLVKGCYLCDRETGEQHECRVTMSDDCRDLSICRCWNAYVPRDNQA